MTPDQRVFVGIDPGNQGAIAFYRPHDNALHIYNMPTKAVPIPASQQRTSFLRNIKNKRVMDIGATAEIFIRYHKHIHLAVIEDVTAMTYVSKDVGRRGQGAASSFKFGKSAGALFGILATLKIPTLAVRPVTWKLQMGLSADKKLSLRKAIDIFPLHKHKFEKFRDEGKAEASLLAWLGYETLNPSMKG